MKNSILLFMLLLMLPLFAVAASTKINAIDIREDHHATHLTFNLTEPVRWHIFSLAHPKRIIIDFEDARLSFNWQKIILSKIRIVNIRVGYPKSGMLRIVLDVHENVHYNVNAKQNTKQIKMNLVSNEVMPWVNKSKKAESHYLVKPIVVVIDPGHGGKDPGAMGQDGTREKDIVLSISKTLANLVNQQPNMRAVLTRDGDYFVSLRKRLQIARQSKADLFIAIHADSYFNDRAAGASVYSLSHHGATSVAARWLAERENHSELGGVDLDGLDDQSPILRSVLLDLAQTATNKASLRCGANLLESLSEVTKLHYPRVEQAPFMVLKSPDIPSLLVETGFISNIKEENRLRDKKHQYRLAIALFEGIHAFQEKYLVNVSST